MAINHAEAGSGAQALAQSGSESGGQSVTQSGSKSHSPAGAQSKAQTGFPAAAYHWPDARGHFGPYGGLFVPETLMRPLDELTLRTLPPGSRIPR